MTKKGDIIHDGEDYGKVLDYRLLDTKALNIKSFEDLLNYFHELEPNPKKIIVTVNVSWDDEDESS
jgi:hypothetical protein